MKILLVEDDDFVRTLLSEQLTSENFEVVVHSNVDDAVASLTTDTFDLLITDILMPHKDGTLLIKFSKQHKPSIPVIAITGGLENAQDDYQHLAEMFADETLVKPIKKQELVDLIRRLVEK